MKNATSCTVLSALILALALSGACKKQQSDADAIRAGITRHLLSLNTLNVSAMDMDVTSLSIQGTQAQARVSFRPKTGAPEGAAMQVAYQLEKRDGDWIVTRTEVAGGLIEHPEPGANPHLQPKPSWNHGELPNLRELIGPPISNSSPNLSLPPGHPPVNTSPNPGDGASHPKRK